MERWGGGGRGRCQLAYKCEHPIIDLHPHVADNIYPPVEEKKHKDDGKDKKKHKEGHTKEKKDRKSKDGKSKKPKKSKDRNAFGHEVDGEAAEATECEAIMDAVDRKAEGEKSKKSTNEGSAPTWTGV